MNFHAHIYFTPETAQSAQELQEKIVERYKFMREHVVVYKAHEEPIGPHPLPMFQITFDYHAFPDIVHWLMMNRNKHTVLIHPITDPQGIGGGRAVNAEEDLLDHTERPIWMGSILPLDINKL